MGHVYVMASEHIPGLVKVGKAKDSQSRLCDMRTGSPGLQVVAYVDVVECVKIEKLTHNVLGAHHVDGEWFRCTVNDALAAIMRSAERFGAVPAPVYPSPRQFRRFIP